MWLPFSPPCATNGFSRRRLLAGAVLLPTLALTLRPARAEPAEMQAAIRALVGEVPIRPGRVELEIAPLVENGNTVPVTVRVKSPMTASDHVRQIAIFTESNPQPNVAVFHLGPRAGIAKVYTRMRLATSQSITALAVMSDGSVWSDRADVIVTLAACVEG